MNPEIINRVINLIDKDNERVVLVDPETGRAVVIMDLGAYEKMKDDSKKMTKPVKQEVKETKEIKVEKKKVESKEVVEPKVEEIAKKTEKVEEIRSPYPPARKKKDPFAVPAFSDLTQSELLDKINCDIASWKTAQESKREGELAAAAKEKVLPAINEALEEEEKFYLEPVE